MLVLDTDHLTALGYLAAPGLLLRDRLQNSGQEVVTTAITVDEQLSGLLAVVHHRTNPESQIFPYAELIERIEFIAGFVILPWDSDSVQRFCTFKAQGNRCGTMDLKIACIALAHDSLLLTRNTKDFAKVPGLRFENWLD